jgi:hypothetical protein
MRAPRSGDSDACLSDASRFDARQGRGTALPTNEDSHCFRAALTKGPKPPGAERTQLFREKGISG